MQRNDSQRVMNLSLGYAIVADLGSKHPGNVAASQPRAPLTLRFDRNRSTPRDRRYRRRFGSATRNRIGKTMILNGYKSRKKRTPTRLTFYYSHPLRPAPSSRATTFRGNCCD